MRHLLQDCIDNFGTAPRTFSIWDRLTYIRIPKPSWLRQYPNDRLKTLFQNSANSFSNGTVVWGHIVQANRLMWTAGNDDCPGELVYSLDDERRVTIEELQEVVYGLGRLKGQVPTDDELAPIAAHLTNERTRVFGLRVPRSISPIIRCKISTTFFVRKHLPGRRLCRPLLPIVVDPDEPHVALPLPERYWPEELLDWWLQ